MRPGHEKKAKPTRKFQKKKEKETTPGAKVHCMADGVEEESKSKTGTPPSAVVRRCVV